MKRNFVELQRFLLQKYPTIFRHPEQITGSTHPSPEWAVHLSQIATVLQLFLMAFLFLGDTLWSILPFNGVAPHPIFSQISENKMQVFIGSFLLSSFVSQFTITGAFEVDFDGVNVFSKLELGRMPLGIDVIQGLEKVFETLKVANNVNVLGGA